MTPQLAPLLTVIVVSEVCPLKKRKPATEHHQPKAAFAIIRVNAAANIDLTIALSHRLLARVNPPITINSAIIAEQDVRPRGRQRALQA